MKVSHQLIRGLCEKNAYPHDVSSITVVETHISWVLLTGQFAYKVKKPVDFGFLDFSTLTKRHHFCQEELRLNRRFAEMIYLDVVPITGTPEQPVMDGKGEAIEYAVKMAQFPSGRILSQIAETGELNNEAIDQLAGIVAGFHESIARADDNSPYGDCRDIKKWFDENFSHILPRLVDEQQLAQLHALETWGGEQFSQLSSLMNERKQQGFVRECHGDLHLGNMTFIDGKIILFDCIEFNSMLRWIDVVSEVAFLFIDLAHYGYRKLAHRFLNRYLNVTGDYSGLALLRFYLVYRALVRAKVTLLRHEQRHQDKTMDQQTVIDYLGYVQLADLYTKAQPPLLIITHGFSGSGKSTLSEQLAENIGAIHIRSDIERKRLYGHSPMTKTGSSLDGGIYSAEAGRLTYRKLAELAEELMASGFPVIVDAAFLKLEQREWFIELASECGSQLVLIDCHASESALHQRIQRRQQQGKDASEATVDILRHQLESAEPLTEAERMLAISVDSENSDALNIVLSALQD